MMDINTVVDMALEKFFDKENIVNEVYIDKLTQI